MARIVYGVSGEGSGHSSRAREVAGHLLARGHEVRLASYDRGYRNLHEDFDVHEIEGLSIGTRENRVSILATIGENAGKLPALRRTYRSLREELFEGFRPDVVLTDFEPMTARLANRCGVPLVSIDNQHRMRYMRYPHPPGLGAERRVTETVIRAMVPRPALSFVTTFWFGEVTNERTFLFPPILRRAVRDAVPSEGDHVLVYVTKAFDQLLDVLRARSDTRFRVYGFGDAREEGHISFRPFSFDGFLADLASARAVVGTAGFTLITESLHLGKPYLALPMRGQFEQELNAHLLQASGEGMAGARPTSELLGRFLGNLDRHRAARSSRAVWDHDAIFGRLDAALADDAAEIRAAHAARGGRRRAG